MDRWSPPQVRTTPRAPDPAWLDRAAAAQFRREMAAAALVLVSAGGAWWWAQQPARPTQEVEFAVLDEAMLGLGAADELRATAALALLEPSDPLDLLIDPLMETP